jgi:AraC family transcriptional regulator, positive regulator of tynA and feaB
MPSRLIVSTTDVSRDDGFCYFREKVADYFDGLELVEPQGEILEGRFETLDIGDAQICRITGSEHEVRRSRAELRRLPSDKVSVNYCDGDYFLADRLGSGTVQYGALRVIDNANEFELRLPKGKRAALYCFQIPRMAFGENASFQKINATLANSRLGLLISEQYRVLAKAMRLDSPAAVWAAAHATKAMLLSLSDVADQSDRTRDVPNVGIASLKSYILSRLSDPALNIEAVARAFHCSERTVQNRFASEGETFSCWLLSQRLARAQEFLQAPAYVMRSVEWIGFSCGFVAASHFHRAFKDRFGTTPRAFRGQGCPDGQFMDGMAQAVSA